MNELEGIATSIAFGAVLALAPIEMVVAAGWWAPYFRRGFVVYSRLFPMVGPQGLPSTAQFESRFRGGPGPSLAFKEIGLAEVAFREAYFELRLLSYTPVLHGLLRVEPTAHSLRLEARPNWFPLAFSLLAVWCVVGVPLAWPTILFFLALLGGIGAFQISRYRSVAEYAATYPGHSA